MLTPQQISQIQTGAGIPNSGSPTAPASKVTETVAAVPTPAGSSVAPAQNESMGSNYLSGVGSAIKSGYEQMTGAETNSIEGKENPLESGTDIASGLASIVSSPLAPIFKPLTDLITNPPKGSLMDKITSDPEFQKFANSPTGTGLSKIAKIIGNLANVAGTEAGVASIGEAAPKVGEALGDIKETLTPKEEPPGGGGGGGEKTPPTSENLETAKINLSQAKQEAQTASQAREEAAGKGVKAVQDINKQVAQHKLTLGQQFANDAADIEKNNPDLKLNITNDQLQALQALKEGKNFTLPKSLDIEGAQPTLRGQALNLGPNATEQIKNVTGQMGGETTASLSPTEAQDLIKELNRSTFKETADGNRSIDYQRIGITNEIKNAASQAFGKDWDNIYSKYAQGRTAIDKIDNMVNLDSKATPEEINSQLNSIQKLSKTPEGKILLQQAVNEYKTTSGIDLNDPVKAIQQIADSQSKLDEAQGKVSDVQKDVEKAQAEVDKLDAQKNMPIEQKIKILLKSRGSRWADYALRFIAIRYLYGIITKK